MLPSRPCCRSGIVQQQPMDLGIWPTAFRHKQTALLGPARKQGADRPFVSAGSLTIKRQEYCTFTNSDGEVLKQLSNNVWAADRPFMWNGIDVGGRMAVLRLSDGSIWVHSPVELDDALADALRELGDVKHIVSPNYEHTKYAQQWIERYPAAKSYACPGLREKKPEVPYTAEIGTSSQDPPEWLGEIQSTWLSYERNPFNGKPFFNEVVFLFKAARLLVTADLYWNYPDQAPGGTKLWKFGMDKVYLPFYRSFMIKQRGEFHEKMRRLLNEWDFDAILPCHGDFVSADGKEVLRKHLSMTTNLSSSAAVQR